MSALTPNLRAFLFCDQIIGSEIEEAVFDAEGIRDRIVVDSFPHWHSVNGFLALAYHPGGTFSGAIRLVEYETEDRIHEINFQVTFDPEDDGVFLPIDLGPCIFPEPGRYNGEVWFFGVEGQEIQKAERSILLMKREG
jgi:hypothetical protein